jgi:hypothetical protein
MKSDPVDKKTATDKNFFMGFYNASIGVKQKITGKNSVSVEPFIKIPVKPTADQKLSYKNVGIRLMLDF